MSSISRIGKLLRIELEVKGKLISMLFIAAVALTIYITFDTGNPNTFPGANNDALAFIKPKGVLQKFHFNWFPTFLYGLGLAITSIMFYEYRGGKSRNFHLTIPASLSEKWWSKIIAYILIGNLVIILSYQLIGAIINRLALSKGLINCELGFFDPYLWTVIKGYLCIQALFVLGAVFSQRFSFIKTGVVLIALTTVCKWLTYTTSNSILEKSEGSIPFFNTSGSYNSLYSVLSSKGLSFNGPESIISVFSHPSYLSWIIVIASMIAIYIISYIRFKELES